MLPDIDLDNEDYEEILEEAKNILLRICPEWTDFNAHDPGITMLELFAMLKESQQFFADRIGEENKKKYLKLLGIHRRKKCPAHSLVQMDENEDYRLFRNHKMKSGNLCFETKWPKRIVHGDIVSCQTVRNGMAGEFVGRGQIEFGDMLHFPAFGKEPAVLDALYICLGEALPVHEWTELYVGIYQNDKVKRNPLTEEERKEFIPLVRLQWQYYTRQGWSDFEKLVDESVSFLFNGFVRFMAKESMEQVTVFGRTGYFIRVLIKDGGYDVPPILTKISMNICGTIQRDTLTEYRIWDRTESIELDTELAALGESEIYIGKGGFYYFAGKCRKRIFREEGRVQFLPEKTIILGADSVMVINREASCIHKRQIGTGNGFPCQKIDLEDLQVEYESFEILVEDAQGKGFCFWHKVEDFSASSQEDRHYVLDSQKGIVCFGDCIHGMAPEGEILLAGYARTMGSHVFGGRDEETFEECFSRAGKKIRETGCAVTKQDYENYVKKAPGLMIESCKALQAEEVRQFMKNAEEADICLVVKPYGWKKGSPAEKNYLRNIKRYLEQYRMIGSRLVLFFPEYIEVDVYVEVVVNPQYFPVEEKVCRAVGDFFSGYQETFGSVIACSRLYGFLDRQDFVVSVRSLNLDAKGNGVKKTRNGDIQLSPYGMAVLKEVKSFLITGEGC